MEVQILSSAPEPKRLSIYGRFHFQLPNSYRSTREVGGDGLSEVRRPDELPASFRTLIDALLPALTEGDHAALRSLPGQLSHLRVTSAEFTGAGCYVDFEVDGHVSLAARRISPVAPRGSLCRAWPQPTVLGAVAQIWLGPAKAKAGDVAAARRAYRDAFAAWKDADADLPPLVKAKNEYAALR